MAVLNIDEMCHVEGVWHLNSADVYWSVLCHFYRHYMYNMFNKMHAYVITEHVMCNLLSLDG